MILCDAGVLLCLIDRTQPQHNAYKNTIVSATILTRMEREAYEQR